MANPTRFQFPPATTFTARLEPMYATEAFGRLAAGDLIVYTVLCGRAYPCRGRLGFLIPPFYGVVDDWWLDHEDGYRGRPDTGYHVMKDRDEKQLTRERNGWTKRPLDSRKLEPWVAMKYLSIAPDSTIGQRPVLPCRVFCPLCKQPNNVSVPAGMC